MRKRESKKRESLYYAVRTTNLAQQECLLITYGPTGQLAVDIVCGVLSAVLYCRHHRKTSKYHLNYP
jgi:hypothetical protein